YSLCSDLYLMGALHIPTMCPIKITTLSISSVFTEESQLSMIISTVVFIKEQQVPVVMGEQQ
ncbi:hypothetical protein, partial [Escherichia albertii]|uniref:hypothetical protein n=1 Tax=Escherichia albertii TaxID=208962 RepID=UPI0021E6D826